MSILYNIRSIRAISCNPDSQEGTKGGRLPCKQYNPGMEVGGLSAFLRLERVWCYELKRACKINVDKRRA